MTLYFKDNRMDLKIKPESSLGPKVTACFSCKLIDPSNHENISTDFKITVFRISTFKVDLENWDEKLEEDSFKRDFTVNMIYYNPMTG